MLSMTYSEEAVMLALAFVDSFCRLCPQVRTPRLFTLMWTCLTGIDVGI